MKDKLLSLINEFGQTLSTSEYNQYIFKLRDYLVPYIIENKHNESVVDRIFKDEFTRNDIINATIFYVKENQNVDSLSAIDDFLIAVNRLFDELLFERFPNPTLMKFKPFSSLSNEIQEKLSKEGIILKEREVFPAIDNNQFKFIIQYLNNSCKLGKRDKIIRVKIIIKLMLLYGFSHDLLAELKISNYNKDKRTLDIEYNRIGKRYIQIELPYSLAKEFDNYLDLRAVDTKDDYLFINNNNNRISNSFITDTLNNIKDEYYNENIAGLKYDRNQFTPTGLQKYAIIQMILAGMNQSIIMDFTWQKEDIYNDCQNEVNRIKELNRNRYINHTIRGIASYDDISD